MLKIVQQTSHTTRYTFSDEGPVICAVSEFTDGLSNPFDLYLMITVDSNTVVDWKIEDGFEEMDPPAEVDEYTIYTARFIGSPELPAMERYGLLCIYAANFAKAIEAAYQPPEHGVYFNGPQTIQ